MVRDRVKLGLRGASYGLGLFDSNIGDSLKQVGSYLDRTMNTRPIDPLARLWTVTKTCILLFVALIGVLIIVTSFAYFPPQFDFGFLLGRDAYFFSWYAIVFYIHVISSPIALFIGLIQSVEWLRKRSHRVHQALGYGYVCIVLLFTAPSGLAMSIKASGGSSAIIGFSLLAIATFVTTLSGFRAARLGRFIRHRQWMTRSYLLICSAVVLRLIAAVCAQLELDHITYGAMAWLSWLPSLLIYETVLRVHGYRIAR